MEGRDPVHPGAPEVRNGGVWDEGAAEGNDKGEKGRCEKRGEKLVWRHRGDELAKSDVEYFEQHQQHPRVAGFEGVS